MLNSGGYMKKPASLSFDSLSEKRHKCCCSLFLNFLSNDLELQLPYFCMCESLIYENCGPIYFFRPRDKIASWTYKPTRFELCSNI